MRTYYNHIKENEEDITYYRLYLSELNYQNNFLKDQLNIAISHQKISENLLNMEENDSLINDFETISIKIIEFESLLEKRKITLKNLKNNYKIIQEQLYEIKKNEKSGPENQVFNISINIESIKKYTIKSENIIEKLNENEKLYVQKEIEIENEIYYIQTKIEKQVISTMENLKKGLSCLNLNKYYSDIFTKINDSLFLKESELLKNVSFRKAGKIIKLYYSFKKLESEVEYLKREEGKSICSILCFCLKFMKRKEPKTENEIQKLIKDNWYEICYINDDCDIHDISYDLKAVGLSSNMFFTSSFFDFPLDTNIKIILFKINGQIVNYDFEKYSLRFKIYLTNFESIKIHIIYKESPCYDKMTENQKEMRNIYRRKYYGLSYRLVGQKAKYILVNSSHFEIINFEDEFFIKNEQNNYSEYQWQGIVPENGKETLVRLSKKEAHINFYEKYTVKTLDNSLIKNSSIKITYCYNGGNNTLIKLNYNSMQASKIILNQNKSIYEVCFIDTKSPIGEFILEGELINRCKGEWKINLTDEEIDNLVPPDYIENKEQFKSIALDIIKEYDQEQKHNIVAVHDVVKIGKWVNKKITYDPSYIGMNSLTARKTFQLRSGVCHHITKLFNALMYSLGYQVLYILGYVIDIAKSFSINDSHAWSLIKIDGKWLPFDATNGIFSGKLPVTYVFKQIEDKSIEPIICKDKVEFKQIEVNGNFIS